MPRVAVAGAGRARLRPAESAGPACGRRGPQPRRPARRPHAPPPTQRAPSSHRGRSATARHALRPQSGGVSAARGSRPFQQPWSQLRLNCHRMLAPSAALRNCPIRTHEELARAAGLTIPVELSSSSTARTRSTTASPSRSPSSCSTSWKAPEGTCAPSLERCTRPCRIRRRIRFSGAPTTNSVSMALGSSGRVGQGRRRPPGRHPIANRWQPQGSAAPASRAALAGPHVSGGLPAAW